MEEHVQHTTPQQYLDNIQIKESKQNLCEVKKLFKKGRKGKMEPCSKLFLGKVCHVIRNIDL